MATKKAAPRNEAAHDAKRTAKRWNLTATDETRALAKRLAEGLGVSESKLVAMALVALESRKRKPNDAS
jgi:hypothetical protein